MTVFQGLQPFQNTPRRLRIERGRRRRPCCFHGPNFEEGKNTLGFRVVSSSVGGQRWCYVHVRCVCMRMCCAMRAPTKSRVEWPPGRLALSVLRRKVLGFQ